MSSSNDSNGGNFVGGVTAILAAVTLVAIVLCVMNTASNTKSRGHNMAPKKVMTK